MPIPRHNKECNRQIRFTFNRRSWESKFSTFANKFDQTNTIKLRYLSSSIPIKNHRDSMIVGQKLAKMTNNIAVNNKELKKENLQFIYFLF